MIAPMSVAAANRRTRICAADGCGNLIGPEAHHRRLFCSPTCQKRTRERRARARKKGKPEPRLKDMPAFLNPRRGELYERLATDPVIVDGLLKGNISQKEAATLLGTTQANVSRTIAALVEDAQLEKDRGVWAADPTNLELLGPSGDPPEGREQEWLDALIAAFTLFRERFFRDERGNYYITKAFHANWIRAICETVYKGGQRLILSPPRHGKTELLIHFCVWMMMRNPNIRILWIAANATLAGDWIVHIKDHLENNTALRAAFLPPGLDFKPARKTGKPWSKDQIILATRTIPLKSPTLQAVGRGGQIRSRDVDLMVMDDIENTDSTAQDYMRVLTRTWFAEVATRVMQNTGFIVITSRVHPDDLAGYLLENTEWDSIVEAAHSIACELDPNDEDIHVDCMLFPELRSYRWLMGRRRTVEVAGEGYFQMVYQNIASGERMAPTFIMADLRDCLDRSRTLGPPHNGCRLVAGLDPASAGFQASFLWAYDPLTGRQYMADLDNMLGGGIQGARQIIAAWYDRYRCDHWVIEENAFQRAIRLDEKLREYCNERQILLEGVQTYRQKTDEDFGVGAYGGLFSEWVWVEDRGQETTKVRRMSLPYKDGEAQAKTDLFLRQAKWFSDGARPTHRTGKGIQLDVLMASWFPQKVMRRWAVDFQGEVELEYEPSFAKWGEPSPVNETPW